MRPLSNIECRVYGPPGTGKTTWIAKRASEIAERVGSDQVSICSLTNTAVKEVAGRDIPIEEGNITTLHARCKRALSAPPPAESFVKEFADAYPRQATEGCLPPSLLRKPTDGDAEDVSETIFAGGKPSLYEDAQIMRQQMVPRSEWGSEVRSWYKVWEGWCRETGRMDFTGWLEESLRVRPLPAQQVVFIDEAQDHTPLQLAVIRSWNCRQRILVGDDDQNLYEWSGALPAAFLDSKIAVAEERVLEQSYRIPQAVHRASVDWIREIRGRKDKIYLPTAKVGSVSYSYDSLKDFSEYGFLPEILDRNSGKSYMILTACGYMLDSVIGNLRESGIPFHNPYRKSNSRWNPLLRIAPKLDDFQSAWSRPERAWTAAEILNWTGALRTKGVFLPGKRDMFLEDFCSKRADAGYIGLKDLPEFFVPEVLSRIDRGDIKIFKDLRNPTLGGAWDYALQIYAKPEEERIPRVIVGTVHSVKGGEADNVFLFPDLSASGYFSYDGYERDRVIRLFYVGMTRAKENLTLCSASSKYKVDWR